MSVQFASDGVTSSDTISFSIVSIPEPGVLLRLIEVFAKRGLVPSRWFSAVVDRALHTDIEISGVPTAEALRIAAAMRSVVGVETVFTTGTRTSFGE